MSAWQTFAEDMHRQGYDGRGVVVNVVDSGGAMNHPEFAGAVVGGINLTGVDSTDLQDRIRHGELVGRIIQRLAPGARFRIIRIFGDEGKCSDQLVGRGLEEAARAGDITNASIGGDASVYAQRGVQAHQAVRIPLVAAAGNSGDGQQSTAEREFPGAYPYPVTVGAIDRGGMVDPVDPRFSLRPAAYSSSYPEVDGVAIGRIPGSWDDGTSFAAPVVTGLLACYISMAKAKGMPYDDDACYQWLISHARQLPGFAPKNDQTGYGMFTLRPFTRLLEVDLNDVNKPYALMDGTEAPDITEKADLLYQAPGGVWGYLRPVMEAMGIRVDYDQYRKRAKYEG